MPWVNSSIWSAEVALMIGWLGQVWQLSRSKFNSYKLYMNMCSIQCMLNLSQITYRKVRHRQYSNHFESELDFIATMSQSFCCSIRLFWIFGAQKLPHWGLIFGSNTKQLWFSMQPSILTTFDLILEFLKAFFWSSGQFFGLGKGLWMFLSLHI